MRAVLDSGFFFGDFPVSGEIYTTPSVISELRDIRSRGQLEKWYARGLVVQLPTDAGKKTVATAAAATKDLPVISQTDQDILALALDLGAELHTDDFAVQNVAAAIGIRTVPILQRKARRIHWKYRCSGCGRYSEEAGECPVCGAAVKRKLK
jgi:UPF0271 protein